jgi:VIT1/CCC1 family predicted Fe2+/Mn2+ transporter
MTMNVDQELRRDLRNTLYNEIKGELTHNEIKEFEKEYIDENFLARLLEKYLKKKRSFNFITIIYSVFVMVLLILFLTKVETLILVIPVTLAIILLPVFIVNLLVSKSFLGYQKIDLVLRLFTRFFVKKKLK